MNLTNPDVARTLERYDSCQECPRGKYGEVEAAINVKLGCKDCTRGRYSDDEGVVNKKNENDGTTVCKACEKGRYSEKTGNIKDSDCVNCGVGKYSKKSGASSETACTDCVAGKYLDKVGSYTIASCKECKKEFSQKERGQAFCLPCIPGRVAKATGATECDQCTAGKYRSTEETDCKECPIGYMAKSTGAVSCFKCSACRFRLSDFSSLFILLNNEKVGGSLSSVPYTAPHLFSGHAISAIFAFAGIKHPQDLHIFIVT